MKQNSDTLKTWKDMDSKDVERMEIAFDERFADSTGTTIVVPRKELYKRFQRLINYLGYSLGCQKPQRGSMTIGPSQSSNEQDTEPEPSRPADTLPSVQSRYLRSFDPSRDTGSYDPVRDAYSDKAVVVTGPYDPIRDL
jgi:hypothetical protein